MSNYNAIQSWLENHRWPMRARILPRRFRDSVVEAYALNRSRFSDNALQRKVSEHVVAESAVPFWLYPVLEVVIRLMIGWLEKWWNNRTTEPLPRGGAT